MARVNGTIKRVMNGFGFVASEGGTEYFFHQSACSGVRFDELREGQAVTFDEGEGPKGPRAENVTLKDTTSSYRWRCVNDVRVASAAERVSLYNRVR